MKNPEMTPLHPGDIALRFRIAWAGHLFRDASSRERCRVFGLEAVEVVAVKGSWVTWTNHKRCAAYAADKFRHTSHRRELIAVASLEHLSAVAPAESAVSQMAGPALAAALR